MCIRSYYYQFFSLLSIETISTRVFAQPVFTDIFPPEEFAARRAKVMEQIGDGVAILQGTTERLGEQPFRQSNQFYYLCGVAEPRSILVVDGKAKRSTLYLYGGADRRERMFGSAMIPGEAAAKATGLDAVLPREDFAAAVSQLVKAGRTIYTPFRPEVLGNSSSSDVIGLAKATKEDPWDGRPSREEVFVEKLKALSADAKIQSLDPILDVLRATKSPREIAIIREATRITGLAIMEAMREARPGLFEYELQADAEYIFKRNGCQGAAYFALIATGQNTFYSHYHQNTTRLKDGDLVQFDYAPDYKYYVSECDAGVSGERKVYSATARVLHDLPAALSGVDDIDQSACCACDDHQGRGGENGQGNVEFQIHRCEDQGGGYEICGALSNKHAHESGSHDRDGGARCSSADSDAGTGAAVYYRTCDDNSGRAYWYPARGCDPDNSDWL